MKQIMWRLDGIHIYIKNSKTKFENNDKFIIDEMDYIYNKIVGIRSNIKKFSNGRDVYVK